MSFRLESPGPDGILLQAYRGIHRTAHRRIVKPARRNGLGLGVELHHLLAVGAEVAELGAARTGETEVGNRNRDRHVDPNLADVDLVLELACHGAALGEDAGAVAVRVGIDEGDVDMFTAMQAYKEVDYPYMIHPDHDVLSPSDSGGEYTAFCYAYIRALIQAVDRPA